MVAYLNVAASARGSRFTVSASTSLGHMLVQVAKEIPHPTNANRTLWDARYDVGPYVGYLDEELQGVHSEVYDQEYLDSCGDGECERDYMNIGHLGAGGDHAVFLHHLGVSESISCFSYLLTTCQGGEFERLLPPVVDGCSEALQLCF